MDRSAASVVVFTCDGREMLLRNTWASFERQLSAITGERLVAIDGPADVQQVTSILQWDRVIQSRRRCGYIRSILSVLSLVRTEYFVWLEDDWHAETDLNVCYAVGALAAHPNWLQVRWSKEAPLPHIGMRLADGILQSSVGFSANPCVCRTQLIRVAFDAVLSAKRGNRLGVDGFENVITEWAAKHGITCAVMDPGTEPMISHLGYLESTGREWHMTASLDEVPTEHLLSFTVRLPFWRRIANGARLLAGAARIAIRQLFDNEAFELAFRFIASTRNIRAKQRRNA